MANQLDSLIRTRARFLADGTALPDRQIINVVGGAIADDTLNERLELTVDAGGMAGWTHAVYVDAEKGDDGTGERGNAAKPFETIEAAFAAAQRYDVVFIGPGTYEPVGDSFDWPDVSHLTVRGAGRHATYLTTASGQPTISINPTTPLTEYELSDLTLHQTAAAYTIDADFRDAVDPGPVAHVGNAWLRIARVDFVSDSATAAIIRSANWVELRDCLGEEVAFYECDQGRVVACELSETCLVRFTAGGTLPDSWSEGRVRFFGSKLHALTATEFGAVSALGCRFGGNVSLTLREDGGGINPHYLHGCEIVGTVVVDTDCTTSDHIAAMFSSCVLYDNVDATLLAGANTAYVLVQASNCFAGTITANAGTAIFAYGVAKGVYAVAGSGTIDTDTITGTANLINGTVTVTLPTPRPNANYIVDVEPSALLTWYTANKTATQFDIVSNAINNGAVWTARRI